MPSPFDPAERCQYIGGTDASAIIGYHPYKRPIDVFDEKVNGTTFQGNYRTDYGHHMEPFVARKFSEITGLELYEFKDAAGNLRSLQHPKYPWIRGNPDRGIEGTRRLLSIKTTNVRTINKWGDKRNPLTENDVPFEHYIQETWYCGIGDEHGPFEGSDYAVHSDASNECLIYSMDYDPEFFESVLAQVNDFWSNHIEKEEPPPVDNSTAYADYLAKRYPQATPESAMDPTLRTNEIAERLREIRSDLSTLFDEKRGLESEIKTLMGANASIRGVDYKARWYNCSNQVTSKQWQDAANSLATDYALVLQLAADAGLDIPENLKRPPGDVVKEKTQRTQGRRFGIWFDQ